MSSGEPEAGQKIVITGIAGRLGRLLARRLHRDGRFQVIGIDRRPFHGRPKDIEHVQVDLRNKKARDVFRGGDVAALVHMGVMHNPRQSEEEHHSWNIGGTSRILDACLRYEVPKVVVLSSANVYGPRPDNSQFLTEDAPLLGSQEFPEIRDLIEVDHLASNFLWKARDAETVILRPVHILGGVGNAPSNYLRLPVIPTLLGFDPMVQIVHELDLVEAIVCALKPGARGVYNVAGPGELPLSEILSELGKPVLRFPHPMARPLLATLWRFGATSFPVPELDFIRYVCMVDGARAREEIGYRPRFTLQQTIQSVNR
jgi:UDP-glucose 4-epimerase